MMEVSETSVAEFVELTGASNDTARFHLEAAAGRLDAAVEAYFGAVSLSPSAAPLSAGKRERGRSIGRRAPRADVRPAAEPAPKTTPRFRRPCAKCTIAASTSALGCCVPTRG